MTISTIDVQGMTCQHCVASVTEELSEVKAVTDVAVQLNPGGTSQVTITSDGDLDAAQVAAAIDEAGYALAP
ncbi:heavy-metal-associated domain-containing protein [Dermacoccaceae bacterium W4C1]